jgi:hypothetical protein
LRQLETFKSKVRIGHGVKYQQLSWPIHGFQQAHWKILTAHQRFQYNTYNFPISYVADVCLALISVRRIMRLGLREGVIRNGYYT